MGGSAFTFLNCFTKFHSFSWYCIFSGYTFDKDESDSLVNDDYIFLCEEIGHRWERFARQVNIKENTIVNIANQSHSDSDRCYKIFRELEARDGSVKQNLIIMALQDLEYDTILSKFKSGKRVSNQDALLEKDDQNNF